MNLYTDFWKKTFKEVLNRINPIEPYSFEMPVNDLLAIGDRLSSGYNGKLIIWAGKTQYNKDSAVFRSLKELVDNYPQLVNKIPGELILKISENSKLTVNYKPITFDLLVFRYRNLPIEVKKHEIYKWKLVKTFQDGWNEYKVGRKTFVDFFKQVDFRNLIYHGPLGVIRHIARDKPSEFENLLLTLYNESMPLKERIVLYLRQSEELYFSLPGHGQNTFQDERTIATLLTFRHPDKYTLFKDTFYSVLSKGLGVKPAPKNEKLIHYYSIVNDFLRNCLPQHPEIIEAKKNLLDKTCYTDNENRLLAQDIFYKTLTEGSVAETETDEDIIIQQETKLQTSNTPDMPLNTILYGPPGTGKTYHTINHAVAIANPSFNLDTASRKEIKDEYERLVKEGQIEFVTFHQSMSYEDFIEGIKPVFSIEDQTGLKYEIRDGVFKRLAERATLVPEQTANEFSVSDEEFEKASIYKISLGDTSSTDDDSIYKWCIDNGYIALGWGAAVDLTGKSESEIQKMVPDVLEKYAGQALSYFIHYIKQGDYVVVTYGNLKFRAIGKVTGPYEFKNIDGVRYHQFRKVQWLLKDVELPFEVIYNKQFSQASVYRLDKREIKKDYFVKGISKSDEQSNTSKNYVLIIDEINRGNVSQIFGELITLIESDKRKGATEALSITLPYSKESFSVPSNLYLIGTMNTADRSVEALDTALRRRFEFIEMSSRPELLHSKQMLLSFWNEPQWIQADEEWYEEPYKSMADSFYDLIGMTRAMEDKLLMQDIDEDRIRWEYKDFELINENEFTGIRLDFLITSINQRLQVLLTKDHTIGHAWLMKVYSLADLQAAFKNKILPLLQEFFYNDYGKIGLVLGEKFVEAKPLAQNIFKKFDAVNELASEYSDKIIYTLKDPFTLPLDDFKSIYQ